MVQNLEIFNYLFKGRSDVFAIRWERDGKSGYMPAYILGWEEYKIHKSKGGTLKDFTDKQYAPLTNNKVNFNAALIGGLKDSLYLLMVPFNKR